MRACTMQETACDKRAVKMLRSTFRLASVTCGHRTAGVTLLSGVDARQMSDSASHSGSGAGSGTGGGAGGQTEPAAGEQPAPGEETAAAAEQHRNEDGTSAIRRAMSQAELSIAQSQAVLIMHNLVHRLTTLVTHSLRSDNGSEEAAMIANEPPEHHRMLISVRDQATRLAQTEFQQTSSGIRGAGPEAVQLEGVEAVGGQQASEAVDTAEPQIADAIVAEVRQAMFVVAGDRTRSKAEVERAMTVVAEEQVRFESEARQVIEHAERVMKRRSVSKWEKSLREAVTVNTAEEQKNAECTLLSLGIPERHWRQLGVREKLDRGEWVIFNVNVLDTHQHFVLLKPKSKMMTRKQSHVVLQGLAFCARVHSVHAEKMIIKRARFPPFQSQ